jgi:hypothetical protein
MDQSVRMFSANAVLEGEKASVLPCGAQKQNSACLRQSLGMIVIMLVRRGTIAAVFGDFCQLSAIR